MEREYRATMSLIAVLVACLGAVAWADAAGDRVGLGRLATGDLVSFVRNASGQWGIEISDSQGPKLVQPRPVRLEIYTEANEVRPLATGYKSLEGLTTGASGSVDVAYGADVTFQVEDHWTVTGAVLSVHRKVRVDGERKDGFLSAVMLSTTPQTTWPDLDYLAPGLLYGDPTYDGDSSPGGTLNYQARRFWMREDFLPAPLFAMAFRDGTSITVLDPAPKGDTTLEESRANAGQVFIDRRFSFGALGANQAPNGGVEIGFRLPGSTDAYAGQPGQTQTSSWRRRYHPIKDGFVQEYDVAFRFGQNESFPQLIRNSWRWAWQTLKPALNYHDIELVRRTLIDHLSERVITVEGRTGIPFIVSTKTGKVWPDTDGRWGDETWWWRAILGFVGKNIEAADQLLREAERDPGPRGQKIRQQGLDIIDTFVRLVPMSPPAGTGFNLLTGKMSMTNPQYNTWYLRAPAEDMRMLMEAYRREKKAGHDHPQWIKWCCDFADWALTKQRQDGSFPRGFRPGTGEVVEESGTTSYNVVPLFLMLSEDTGDGKYRDAAIRAAEYVWQSFGTKGVFIGGAIDNPNITDKEAGLLSMEAFLSLYEATKEAKWLTRAEVAGDFAESWMWIWNVPMPVDANDEELHWKRGVPTVGVQGITARVAGHVDEYLDWSTPAYAKLYRYTKDPHYLDVARILLHNCKAMLALPGRTYGMLGPGWQQENWRMGPSREGRGFGTAEKWMPWVSTNHLYSITGLEQFDTDLYKQLIAKPAGL